MYDMKTALLFPLIFLVILAPSKAQNIPSNTDSLRELVGSYEFAAVKLIIRMQDEKLLLDFPGQGQVGLTPVTSTRFRADHVRPEAIIEFVKDSLGRVSLFRWIQNIGTLKWNRINDDGTSPHAAGQQETSGPYEGRYKLRKSLLELVLTEDQNQLKAKVTGEGTQLTLSGVSANEFAFKSGGLNIYLRFQKMQNGRFQEIVQTRTGPIEYIKIPEEDNKESLISRTSNSRNGFTRSDTLRGMLTPLRTCYNVLFYNLDVKIFPDTRSITGANIIRFRAMEDFHIIQVDLYANMKIESIKFHNADLPYKREFNAVLIQFPDTIRKGAIEEIAFTYSGQPQVANFSTLTGGFIWYRDKNDKPWIETVCQGAGASLWWPCKDHLSDKPDSMKISVTVPKGLSEISNGKLLAKTDLDGKLTRFDWYVSYPITNYNVVVNIGDYVHFADQFVSDSDTLALNYYSLTYNRRKAEQLFKNTKPMLALYEERFGKYPFTRDGFTVMESLYPMEHQSAVSIGSINNPINSNKVDKKELIRTMWHEVAHEWWGNSITCSDMADLWIHEAFATYTETLNYEAFYDKETALRHLHGETPNNKEPIIGMYNVNDFHLGDMYSKGALMLHTLRSVLANDSLFFNLLRGMQDHFQYQPVSTEMIVAYVNENAKQDLTAFFDQYLKFPEIPELNLKFTKEEDNNWKLQYRWNAQAKGFNMPVRVTKTKNEWSYIYPNADWQQLPLKDLKPFDFMVDKENFYISVRKE